MRGETRVERGCSLDCACTVYCERHSAAGWGGMVCRESRLGICVLNRTPRPCGGGARAAGPVWRVCLCVAPAGARARARARAGPAAAGGARRLGGRVQTYGVR